MGSAYFPAQTLDDVMRSVIEDILKNGTRIEPSKGPCTELTGVLLEIADPRARLSRTETKGKPFSGLGELCWYLAQSNDKGFISYYLTHYSESTDGDVIHGAYGPRLFNWRGIDQVRQVINILREKPDSRQAVIQLFEAADIAEKHKDVPCTCYMQFLLREGRLHMITYMRSNDVFLGLPHDTFCFTMLQEIMARALSVELGHYKHIAGSMHLYDTHEDVAQQFLKEGWQPTDMTMPPMPVGDPWPALQSLIAAESAIRNSGHLADMHLDRLEPYWADLIRLLLIFRHTNDNNLDAAHELRKEMSSKVYDSFIVKRLSPS